MALYNPLIGTEMSGRIGGNIFSHNAGGAYIRAGSIPTNPNTPAQQAVRNAVALLSGAWNDILVPRQREDWETYAANVTLTNRIGAQVHVSGMAMYIRSNTPRLAALLPRVDDGPAIFNLGFHTPPTLDNFSEATQLGNFNFTTALLSDTWANEVGGFMLIYFSRPQNRTINFFKGPYRYLGPVTGDPVPPASPAVITPSFAFFEGQKLFCVVRTSMADGRLSSQSFFETVTVA